VHVEPFAFADTIGHAALERNMFSVQDPPRGKSCHGRRVQAVAVRHQGRLVTTLRASMSSLEIILEDGCNQPCQSSGTV